MAPPVRAVLGLPSLPVEDSGHGFIALPDRSTIAIPADTALAGAWSGFRDDDVLSLRSAPIVATPIGRAGASPIGVPERVVGCQRGLSRDGAVGAGGAGLWGGDRPSSA
jgi:hypothetical protein